MAVNLRNRTSIASINVSRRAFWAKPLEELLRQDKCVQSPFTMAESRFSQDECFTSGIISCTAGIIKAKNSGDVFMFHLDPRKAENHWSLLSKQLIEVVESIRQKSGQALEGFLIGADASDGESMTQANNLVEFFKDKKINFSALLGQKDEPGAGLYCSLPERKLTVSFSEADKVKNISELKKYFSRVIVSIHDFKFGEGV